MPRRMTRAVLALALLLPAVPAAAQMTFGVKGGLVSSTLKLSGAQASTAQPFMKRRSSYAGGAFLALGSGLLGLQIEAMYVQKGVKLDDKPDNATGVFRSAYLELPALLRLSVSAGKARPYLYAGGAAAIELKCEGEVTFQGTTTNGSCADAESQSGTQRRKLDLTGLGGAGVQVPVGGVSLLIEARYARGLRALNKSGDTDAKNEALSFLGGVAIPLGAKP